MRGALAQDELGKWTIGLFLLALVGIFLVQQANGGVFSFFKQIPTNLTSYDTGDGYAYVRYNTATLAVEYRQTDSWTGFGNQVQTFTLGDVEVVPGEVKKEFKRYWYEGDRGIGTVSFLQGELVIAHYPSFVSNEVYGVTLWWPTTTCTSPCVKVGDLAASYRIPGTSEDIIFILRSNNAIEFVLKTGSRFTLMQKDVEEAKKMMLAYRDSYLDIPLSYEGKKYCVQYKVSGKEGHLVIDLARPVEDGTVCAGQ